VAGCVSSNVLHLVSLAVVNNLRMQSTPESPTVSRPLAEKADHAGHATSSAGRTCDWPYQEYMRRLESGGAKRKPIT
jgi:hypothetical protein